MHCYTIGLGSCAFARHYLRNHFCFLLLRVLRCFSSPRLPPALRDNIASLCWVAPFGNPRINGYLHLPEAYRSLSRPSSPPRAKASTVRSYLLFLFLLYKTQYIASLQFCSYLLFTLVFKKYIFINWLFLISCFTTLSLFLSICQRSLLFTIYPFTIYYFISQWFSYFWINLQ